MVRGRIDDATYTRINHIKRGELSLFQVIRHKFKCLKCGHTKAFYKTPNYECCKCKNLQRKK
jgi:Zn finger protein HypA/HybF involved in hydrogenase expression